MSQTELTVDYINSNIGNTITWACNGHKGNLPYKGTCIVHGWAISDLIDPTTNNKYMHPLVTNIAGDDLNAAWIDHNGYSLTYSDNYRHIWINPKFDIVTIECDNNAQLSFAVPHVFDTNEFLSAKLRHGEQYKIIDRF